MSKFKNNLSEFNLRGKLLGFVLKDGYKIKYLKMNFSEREYWVKLPKELRKEINQDIPIGSDLTIIGYSQKCHKTGIIKLTATEITLVKKEQDLRDSSINNIVEKNTSKKATTRILVCGKSTCRKQGSDSICQMLENQIKNHHLENEIEIKVTGCLKQCKKAPNLVILPDKISYNRVTSAQIPDLLAKFCE